MTFILRSVTYLVVSYNSAAMDRLTLATFVSMRNFLIIFNNIHITF